MKTFKQYTNEFLVENIGVFQVRKANSSMAGYSKYDIHHKGKPVGHILVNNQNKLTSGKLFNKRLGKR